MNIVFRLVIFSILLNLATGFVQHALVDVNNTSIYREGSGVTPYNSSYGNEFNVVISENLTPDSTLSNKGDEVYRILDLTSLGFLMRWLDIIKFYMYGFVVFMNSVFGSLLSPSVATFLFKVPIGLFAMIINVGYGIAGLMLLTGKGINDG